MSFSSCGIHTEEQLRDYLKKLVINKNGSSVYNVNDTALLTVRRVHMVMNNNNGSGGGPIDGIFVGRLTGVVRLESSSVQLKFGDQLLALWDAPGHYYVDFPLIIFDDWFIDENSGLTFDGWCITTMQTFPDA